MEDKINIIDPFTGDEVDVDRHPDNKTPVTELPEMSRAERRARIGDDLPGQELPVLIRSSFRADPCEGDQGSFTKIVEEDCEVCGYDRADFSYHTLAGVGFVECRACRATIEEI
ncbi:hypothetical protein HTZ84_09725 [Haloterrigena sp. SYSU A558-1]|uniref:Halobacterial output domain-containing protein n=1 Tax=Haloterrigena gelatinilytica TaxID=2741724 RepID=A0ABX2LHJ0_9EURY|nr:hypothetical protein [Haloterrigena gelatinilytica]NUC72584.1 hypothetical protein [Haloterrigena gelatinilytica]